MRIILNLDSSLLLSPKADDQMPTTSGNAQVLSQEVPNFLSGSLSYKMLFTL